MSGKAKTAAKGVRSEASESRAINAGIRVTKVIEFRPNAKGNLVPKARFAREENA